VPSRIRLLFDENVRSDVIRLFQGRGHEIILSREVTGISAPDQVIAVFGKYESLVIVSHDNDFRRYRKLLPEHERKPFQRGAGRLLLDVPYERSAERVAEEIEVIEFHYEQAQKRGIPFLMTISKGTVKVSQYV
jgi:hypothetical protein